MNSADIARLQAKLSAHVQQHAGGVAAPAAAAKSTSAPGRRKSGDGGGGAVRPRGGGRSGAGADELATPPRAPAAAATTTAPPPQGDGGDDLHRLQAALSDRVLESRLYESHEAALREELAQCRRREALLESLVRFDTKVEEQAGRGGGSCQGSAARRAHTRDRPPTMPQLPEARIARAKAVPFKARLPPRPTSAGAGSRGSDSGDPFVRMAPMAALEPFNVGAPGSELRNQLQNSLAPFSQNSSAGTAAANLRILAALRHGQRVTEDGTEVSKNPSAVISEVPSAGPYDTEAIHEIARHLQRVSSTPTAPACRKSHAVFSSDRSRTDSPSFWQMFSDDDSQSCYGPIVRNPDFYGFSQVATTEGGTEWSDAGAEGMHQDTPAAGPSGANSPETGGSPRKPRPPQLTAKSGSQWWTRPARPASARDAGRLQRALSLGGADAAGADGYGGVQTVRNLDTPSMLESEGVSEEMGEAGPPGVPPPPAPPRAVLSPSSNPRVRSDTSLSPRAKDGRAGGATPPRIDLEISSQQLITSPVSAYFSGDLGPRMLSVRSDMSDLASERHADREKERQTAGCDAATAATSQDIPVPRGARSRSRMASASAAGRHGPPPRASTPCLGLAVDVDTALERRSVRGGSRRARGPSATAGGSAAVVSIADAPAMDGGGGDDDTDAAARRREVLHSEEEDESVAAKARPTHGYVHPAVYESYSAEDMELQHLASAEALLLAQIEEEERKLAALKAAHDDKEAAYKEEILRLRAQRRSQRVSKPGETLLRRLRRREQTMHRVSTAFEARRQALETSLMQNHDINSAFASAGGCIRCDAVRAPVGCVTVVATGSVPIELNNHVKIIAKKNGGVHLQSSRYVIYAFGSMAAAANMVVNTQTLLMQTGWGEEVLDKGVPQLSFGIANGVAELTTANGKSTLHGRIVQKAIKMEKRARHGEAWIHRDAAPDFQLSKATFERSIYHGCAVNEGPAGGLIFVAPGTTVRERVTKGFKHRRIAYDIEDRSAALECDRMLIEDSYLKSKKAPSGQVTIAFTDIQNSISMWDSHPNAMRVAVDMQNKILRHLLELYNGYEVKNEGDAFMVAFSDAARAMQWTMDLQLRLLKANWPGVICAHPDAQTVQVGGKLVFHGLRVRVGFTTGEPDCCIDPITGRMDYFGPMVNLAARVSGQAKGGEVVVGSAAMSALQQTRSVPSPYVVVSGKGTKMLKGISRAETIFQLCPKVLEKRKEYFTREEKKKDAEKKKDGRKEGEEDEEKKDEEGDGKPGPSRKVSVWDRMLVTRRKGKRKASLDVGRQQELLKMQKVVPKLIGRYRLLERNIAEYEMAFMEQEDVYLHTHALPPTGLDTTIVCVDMHGKVAFLQHSPEETIAMMVHFTGILRRTLERHKGYEVKSDGPAFMLAFESVLKAFYFCLDLQKDVMNAEWPAFLEETAEGARVVNDEGVLVFNGPRLRLGCEAGTPAYYRHDGGRVEYVGKLSEQAEQLCSLSEGGEIGLGIKAYSELLKLDDERQGSILSWTNIIIKTYRGKQKIETFFSLVPWVCVDRREVWQEPQIQRAPIEPRAEVNLQSAVYCPVQKSAIECAMDTLHERTMGKLRECYTVLVDYGELIPAELIEVIDEFQNGPLRSVTMLTNLVTEINATRPVTGLQWTRQLQQTIIAIDNTLIREEDVIRSIDDPRMSIAHGSLSRTGTGVAHPMHNTFGSMAGGGGGAHDAAALCMSPRASTAVAGRHASLERLTKSPTKGEQRETRKGSGGRVGGGRSSLGNGTVAGSAGGPSPTSVPEQAGASGDDRQESPLRDKERLPEMQRKSRRRRKKAMGGLAPLDEKILQQPPSGAHLVPQLMGVARHVHTMRRLAKMSTAGALLPKDPRKKSTVQPRD